MADHTTGRSMGKRLLFATAAVIALLQAAADSAEVSAARAYEDLNVQQFYDGLQQARAAQRGSGEGAS